MAVTLDTPITVPETTYDVIWLSQLMVQSVPGQDGVRIAGSVDNVNSEDYSKVQPNGRRTFNWNLKWNQLTTEELAILTQLVTSVKTRLSI